MYGLRHGQPSIKSKSTNYIEDLGSMMKERLETCRLRTKRYLNHVLFYRDGVSESQFGMVQSKETPQIQAAINGKPRCATSNSACTSKLKFLVMGKRYEARFYPRTSPEDEESFHPGLVIDTTVVSPKQFNLYLQSLDSPRGTARPGPDIRSFSGTTADTTESCSRKW
ncbi:eukaryotic translation initiation factor 2C 2 [Drepanopeziza brunnea f. sp. 'multigermtubi' MB_m1]|uniref:Eukaryotic translation initiation factor 2C 2 n=1 Tax=Marssonina brunnea f. sp. multigermtubi (strain MB_m1) TaxID=1072389 RepID=K1Y6L0_MARBU|nr:eukaryotic translation initiation factor 2C 2 [Drepanopeziza brunnea f. sp. 'multigermtubi' MB_m1]EKD20834.1 eukaryotic translation initiation factor 2C 2 [Drepanopeziza brunnea f. sp. 'multigermtubi' MB_m1]